MVTSLTPISSVTIAIGALLFGIYQFQRQHRLQQEQIVAEQQKDRNAKEAEQILRIQTQIRFDVEQILQFPVDSRLTVSKVSFLLDDLNGLLEVIPSKSQTEDLQARKRGISATFVRSIVEDCDFTRHRDVNYAFTLLTPWDDLKLYLLEENYHTEYILTMYGNALNEFYKKSRRLLLRFDTIMMILHSYMKEAKVS